MIMRRRSNFGFFMGLVLIILGISLLLDFWNYGSWWQFFFIGLGILFLIRAVWRGLMRRGTVSLVLGIILIIIGAGFLLGVHSLYIWAIALIVFGLLFLLWSWLRR